MLPRVREVRVPSAIVVAAILLVQPIVVVSLTWPPERLVTRETLATGPVADPGGPYTATEGDGLPLDGTHSRGSIGDRLAFGLSQVVNPSTARPFDEEAAIASDADGRILVAWIRIDEAGVRWSRLLLSRRLPNGTFTPPLELDAREQVAQGIVSPSVSTFGDAVFVAWGVTGYPPNGVYLRKSVDKGLSFGPARLVHTRGSMEPEFVGIRALLDGSGRVYVSWNRPDNSVHFGGGDVYLARSDDGGETFLPPVRVNERQGTAKSSHPASHSFVVDGTGDLNIAWVAMADSAGDWDVVFSKSDDGGLTFLPPVLVTDLGRVAPTQPDVALGPGTIHVVWKDFREPGAWRQVWYASSSNGGANFSSNRRISDEPPGTGAAARGHALLSDGRDALYLVWADARDGTPRARITVSRDDGASFGPSVRLDAFDSEQHPDGAVLAGDGIAVVWTDIARPAVPRVPEKCSPFTCSSNVLYAEGSARLPIISHSWDLDAAADADGDGDSTNDADATGPSPSVAYGDNGVFEVTLRIVDDVGLSATATTSVTVANVPPRIDTIRVTAVHAGADVWVRVAGEKFHDVTAVLFRNGTAIGNATITRRPGSPDAQSARVGRIDAANGTYSMEVSYAPENDPVNGKPWGATPAWIVLDAGSVQTSLHHTFNARHPDTWTWSVDDLGQHLEDSSVALTVGVDDPGSDDLTLAWEFGDGESETQVFLADPASGPDPFPSPELNPRSIVATASHAYAISGTYVVTLTISDDDGGAIVRTAVVTV